MPRVTLESLIWDKGAVNGFLRKRSCGIQEIPSGMRSVGQELVQGGGLVWSREQRAGDWENSVIFQVLGLPSASASGWACTQGEDLVGILDQPWSWICRGVLAVSLPILLSQRQI